MHLQEAHSYRPIAQFWLASPSRTQVKCGKDPLGKKSATSHIQSGQNTRRCSCRRDCGFVAIPHSLSVKLDVRWSLKVTRERKKN